MDWDDAYANAAHIAGADAYPDRWAAEAKAFRAATRHQTLRYGAGRREVLDLFYPADAARGLVVFVHGGYWLRFDKGYWSAFAAGALAKGYAAAIPTYPLAPDATIPEITLSLARAVQTASDTISGPIRLAGHSAGGHLVARMLCADVDLPCRGRIVKTVPISPVADLRPLMKTQMAGPLRLENDVCVRESPVLTPAPDASVAIWVGADERPVFLEQAEALAEAWACEVHIAPGKHHFDVIDGLADANDPLCQALFS